jgi:protein-S-isoprenylcysteine O-methyltransferase Ste14
MLITSSSSMPLCTWLDYGQGEERGRLNGKDAPNSRWQGVLLATAMTILCVACFPANPLVLTGVIEVESHQALFVIGWVVWAAGMVLVVAPIVTFPRHGAVPEGKSFANTTRLVDTGLYAIVRHPQYAGGILSIFVTTSLWYPHWLFWLLGAVGTAVVYMGCIEEERRMVKKFGDDYVAYMQKVPRVNLVLGFVRLMRRQHD